jgi:hypothetical protein
MKDVLGTGLPERSPLQAGCDIQKSVLRGVLVTGQVVVVDELVVNLTD